MWWFVWLNSMWNTEVRHGTPKRETPKYGTSCSFCTLFICLPLNCKHHDRLLEKKGCKKYKQKQVWRYIFHMEFWRKDRVRRHHQLKILMRNIALVLEDMDLSSEFILKAGLSLPSSSFTQWKNKATREHFTPRLKCWQKSGTDASSSCMASVPTPSTNSPYMILSRGEAYHPLCTSKS